MSMLVVYESDTTDKWVVHISKLPYGESEYLCGNEDAHLQEGVRRIYIRASQGARGWIDVDNRTVAKVSKEERLPIVYSYCPNCPTGRVKSLTPFNCDAA